jgi:hypothetical protein
MARASNHLRRVTDSSAPSSQRAPRAAARRLLDPSFSATIAAMDGDALTIVPRATPAAEALAARLARVAGYVPTVGDVVMVVRDAEDLVVVAVIESARPLAVTAPDGARVALVDGALELVDREGRLLVRYVDGVAEVSPVSGDLRLAAPRGEVRIEAGTDVVVSARRDVAILGDRTAELGAGARGIDLPSSVRVEARGASITGSHVDVTSRATRVTSGEATLVARAARTSATKIETTATRIETTAEHVVVRAKTLVQDVTGLLESKLGRVRTLVKGSFTLRSKSTSMKSQEDTSVDGNRVLLG